MCVFAFIPLMISRNDGFSDSNWPHSILRMYFITNFTLQFEFDYYFDNKMYFDFYQSYLCVFWLQCNGIIIPFHKWTQHCVSEWVAKRCSVTAIVHCLNIFSYFVNLNGLFLSIFHPHRSTAVHICLYEPPVWLVCDSNAIGRWPLWYCVYKIINFLIESNRIK